MAPLPPTKHSRTALSAKDPRGIYAPPSPSAFTFNADPATTTTEPSPADLHTGPSTSLKRKRAAEDFAFDKDGGFRVNKRDKRTIRHNALLAKVKDSGVRKGKVLKRRRPGKKLKTDLGGLADALPETVTPGSTAQSEEDEEEEDGWEGIEGEDGDEVMEGLPGLRKPKRRRKAVGGEGKMVMKSLRHRPGAMKRKRKMEGMEMERFRRNLAQMVGSRQGAKKQGAGGGGGGVGEEAAGSSQADRWKALRSFIGGTMETSAAFGK